MASSVIGLQDATVNTLLAAAAVEGPGAAYAMPPGTSANDVEWDWVMPGPPATVSLNLEGSMDAMFSNPVVLQNVDVVGAGGGAILGIAFPFIRANLVTITGGGSVTVRLVSRRAGGR